MIFSHFHKKFVCKPLKTKFLSTKDIIILMKEKRELNSIEHSNILNVSTNSQILQFSAAITTDATNSLANKLLSIQQTHTYQTHFKFVYVFQSFQQ